MGALDLVVRNDLRRRARRVLLLIVSVGIAGALTLATAAGARRTSSSLARFKASSRSADIELDGEPTAAQIAAVARLPGVAAVGTLRAYGLLIPAAPDFQAIGAISDADFGRTVDRDRIVAGRAPDPAAADEITIGEGIAARLHLSVGGHLDVQSFSPAQIAATLRGEADTGPPKGPQVRLDIVGIVRRPLDLGDRAASGGLLVLTRAFDRAYADRIGVFGLRVRIRTDKGAAAPVISAARRIFGEALLSAQSLAIETQGARNAIDVLALGLWIAAAVAAVAGAVAIGIVLTQEISLATEEQATLRALGCTRRQRMMVAAPSSLLVAGCGAVLASIGAIALSPVFPIGVARRADPGVGLHADWTVLALGFAAVVGVISMIAFVAAVRATRPGTDLAVSPRARPLTVADRAAAAGAFPWVAQGFRMALQSGKGATAVPRRSAVAGAVVGVLGITAVLVFQASLHRIEATPRLYGWTWDVAALDTTSNTPCRTATFGMTGVSGLAALSELCAQNVDLDGRPTPGLAFTSLRGPAIEPSLLAGRAPAGPREVALGSSTLHALHKKVGDTVVASGVKSSVEYTIVGRVAFPTFDQAQPLADGAAFTGEGYVPLYNQNLFNRYFVARYAPGTDRAAVDRRIAAIPQFADPVGPLAPVEVSRLHQIGWLPLTLAALLGALALLAVGHALVTAVRRGRHDLAVLKTLGFVRSEVRAAVAWQATSLIGIGLVVGFPVGLLAGNLGWRLVADGLGVSTATITPILALVVCVPAALVLANAVAFLPARNAGRNPPGRRPALRLRCAGGPLSARSPMALVTRRDAVRRVGFHAANRRVRDSASLEIATVSLRSPGLHDSRQLPREPPTSRAPS